MADNECSTIDLLVYDTKITSIKNLGNLGIPGLGPGLGDLAVKFFSNIEKINKNIENLKLLESQQEVIDKLEKKIKSGGGNTDKNTDQKIETISDDLQLQKIEEQNKMGSEIVKIDKEINAQANNYDADQANNDHGNKKFGKDFFAVFDLPEIKEISNSTKQLTIDMLPHSVLVGLNPEDDFCVDETLNEYIKNKIKYIILAGGVAAIEVCILPLSIVFLGICAARGILIFTGEIIEGILFIIAAGFGIDIIPYIQHLNAFIKKVEKQICSVGNSLLQPVDGLHDKLAKFGHRKSTKKPTNTEIKTAKYMMPDTEPNPTPDTEPNPTLGSIEPDKNNLKKKSSKVRTIVRNMGKTVKNMSKTVKNLFKKNNKRDSNKTYSV